MWRGGFPRGVIARGIAALNTPSEDTGPRITVTETIIPRPPADIDPMRGGIRSPRASGIWARPGCSPICEGPLHRRNVCTGLLFDVARKRSRADSAARANSSQCLFTSIAKLDHTAWQQVAYRHGMATA